MSAAGRPAGVTHPVNHRGYLAGPGEPAATSVVAVLVLGRRVGSVLRAEYGATPCPCCGLVGTIFEPYSRGRMFGHHATEAAAVVALVEGVGS